MNKKTEKQYPSEGGTFKRSKSGELERIGKPQTPDPGKAARAKAAAAAEKTEAKASDAKAPTASTTGKAGKQEG